MTMPYCPACGVELDPDQTRCPLCHAPIPDQTEPLPEATRYSDLVAPPAPRRDPGFARALALRVLTAVFAAPLLVSLGIDFVISGSWQWSRFVAGGIAVVWVFAALPVAVPRRPWLVLSIDLGASLALLWFIDNLDGTMTWFAPLALPIAAGGFLLSGGVVMLARRAKELGANLAGFILTAIALHSVIIDVAIRAYLGRMPLISWSAIVFLALSPLVVLLLSYHYRLRTRPDFQRIFHV